MGIKDRFSRKFSQNESGSAVTLAALTLPVLIGVGAFAVDMGYAYSVKTSAQQAADFGGLATLTQIRDEGAATYHSVSQVNSLYAGQTVVHASANMPDVAKDKAVEAGDVQFGSWDFQQKTFSTDPHAYPVNAVRINAQFNAARGNAVPTFLGRLFKKDIDVSVDSLALLPIPPSFHVLSEDASQAFQMSASDIDVLSTLVNSDASDAFDFQGHSGNIGTATFDVAGEVSGSPGRKVETGATPWADFLEDLPSPPVDGSCDYNNFEATGNLVIIQGGVYCGGLKITGANYVYFAPGRTFIIKDGPLHVDGTMVNKNIIGQQVLIYLTGRNSGLKMESGNLSLRAKMSGEWAGIAIFAARGAEAPEVNTFSRAHLHLEGIFYAPDSFVSFYRSFLNGTCNYLCFASDTVRIERTHINYGPFMIGRSTVFGPAVRPARPPALARKTAPYVIPAPS